MVFRDEKIQKATKVQKKNVLKKVPELFGPIDPICFHKDGVINQHKQMFLQTKKMLPNSVGCTQVYLEIGMSGDFCPYAH